MTFFSNFLVVSHATFQFTPSILVYEMFRDGTCLGKVLSMSDLKFPSFQISNAFIPAKSTILGHF